MTKTEDELYRFLQHYLQLPIDDPHVLGNPRELAQTLPRSASASSMASQQLRRETISRKGSIDSSLLNPIIVLVSLLVTPSHPFIYDTNRYPLKLSKI